MRLTTICARVLAPAALLLLMAAPAAAAAPEPQILTPANQTPVVENTTVTVEGRGCPAGSEVAIRLGIHDLGTVAAAADGTFTTDVRIPEFDLDPAVAESGEAMLKVTCGGLSAGNLVVIEDTDAKPRLTVDEPADGSEVREREVITVSGHGCRYGEPVTVALDRHAPAEAITEAGGTYTVDIEVQAVRADTPVTLTVRCEDASQNIGLTILDTDGTDDTSDTDTKGTDDTNGTDDVGGTDTNTNGGTDTNTNGGDDTNPNDVKGTGDVNDTNTDDTTTDDTIPTSDRSMPSRILSVFAALGLAGVIISGTGLYLRRRADAEPADFD